MDASVYGSNVLLTQIRLAVEAAGGTLIELSTVFMLTKQGQQTIKPEDRACIAEFPDEKSFNKFLDSVRGIADTLEISRTPIQRTGGKVSVSFSVPMKFSK
jgi:hypothetical protein